MTRITNEFKRSYKAGGNLLKYQEGKDLVMRDMLRRLAIQEELKRNGKDAALELEKQYHNTDLGDAANMTVSAILPTGITTLGEGFLPAIHTSMLPSASDVQRSAFGSSWDRMMEGVDRYATRNKIKGLQKLNKKETNPKKFENPSGPITFSTQYGVIDVPALRENPYKIIKKGTPGIVYDVINAGLYGAIPFTGGATAIPAAIMSGVKGAGAIGDMIDNGVDAYNAVDFVTGFAPAIVADAAKAGAVQAKSASKMLNRASAKTREYWLKNLKAGQNLTRVFSGYSAFMPSWSGLFKTTTPKWDNDNKEEKE